MKFWEILLLLVAIGNSSSVEHIPLLKAGRSRMDRTNAEGLRTRESIRPRPCPAQQRADCAQYPDPWASCDRAEDGRDGDKAQLRSLASSITRFALEAYRSIAEDNQGVNLAISPLSVAASLTHLLLGSRNRTRQALEKALEYTEPFSCVHQSLKMLLNSSRSLSAASQLFFRNGLCLEQSFIDRSVKFYGQEPEALTHNATDNVRVINEWVSRNTKGLIPKLVDEVPENTIIMLLNAIQYTGTWKTKFNKTLTKHEEFQLTGGKSVLVPMMQSLNYPLVATFNTKLKVQVGKFQMFGRNSFIVLLPQDPKQSLRDFEWSLNYNDLQDIMNELDNVNYTPKSVLLPLLKIDYTQDLMQPLSEMGLQDDLFHPNLCGLTLGQGISISAAIHRATLSLDETGVEASAGTALSVGRVISTFEANQPFVWLLWDDEQHLPLFMGRVLDPR